MTNMASYMQLELKTRLTNCPELVVHGVGDAVAVCYVSGLIDAKLLRSSIFKVLSNLPEDEVNTELIKQSLYIGGIEREGDIDRITIQLLQGYVYIAVQDEYEGILCNIAEKPSRTPSPPENESHIFGPSLAFNESIGTNMAILRSHIKDPTLQSIPHEIGEKMRKHIQIVYISEYVDEQYVQYILKKLQEIKQDGILSSALLMYQLQNNPYTLFPLTNLTERPDNVVQALLEGKVAIMMDGDAHVIIGPSSFIDFFLSLEDRYAGWGIGIFVRLLRMLGLLMSVFLTPAYVAALTFHYEVIPPALLIPLIETRSRVPFPPLLETLILEVTMELLREAGARLPTKVGQTIGIVGGIVIGQAAVQAGFTSNILIMLVALGALGSYTTPSYLMSASIRLIRFPMIVMAGLWGIIGIVATALFIAIHLFRQTSLGRPYMMPFLPLRLKYLGENLLVTPKSHYDNRISLKQSEDHSQASSDQQSTSSDDD